MWTRVILLTMLLVITAACTPTRGSATDMLPNVPNTKVVEGQSITQFISSLADGAALTAGNPELVLVIKRIESTLKCFQDNGAVGVRTYTDLTFPLSAGIVVIVDRNAVTNLANLTQCLTAQPDAAQAAPTLQPCSKSYTLPKDNNEFFIAYVASTQEMCQAFCSRLEGCQ
jgi:hypothetical protein